MSKERRRALLAAYKEKKPRPGVFAVRCTVTGQTWVHANPNLDTCGNGVWAALKFGGHPNRVLQAAWNTHGADAFVLEEVEALADKDLSGWELSSKLKSRERHWLDTMGATKVAG